MKPRAAATRRAPVIAIDGPSGAGKGTVAAAVAEALGWRLLDSGALYRIVALIAARRRIPFDDGSALARLIGQMDIAFSGGRAVVDGADETHAIRADANGTAASVVAADPAVRCALLATQRGFRKPPGLVADGRDMGTVVFPDATVKVFLTATVATRAERRLGQLRERRALNEPGGGGTVSRRLEGEPKFGDVLKDLEARDARDRERAVSPLVPASDAFIVDTTSMTIDEAVAAVMARVDETMHVR